MLNSSGPQKCLNNIHPIKATKLLVDGELVDSVLGNVNACINPSNGELIVTLPSAGAADLSAAINAARKTFDTTNWPRISSSHRGDYISRLAELLLERKSLLTYLQAIDGGVTRTNSRTDIDEAVDILIQQSYAYRQKPPYPDFHYEKKSKETFNETKVEPESIASSPKSSKRRSPGQEEYATNATASPKKDFHHTLPVASGCGVVLAIISSRGPYLSSLAQVIAPAVVAGESLILLVSEDAPLVALELAALVYQINFPKGSIQVLTGSFGTEGMRVSHFVQHMNINKVLYYR
jgi:acyl-CoA reductase-like NAD-dependent aldehyde dehydrogenase